MARGSGAFPSEVQRNLTETEDILSNIAIHGQFLVNCELLDNNDVCILELEISYMYLFLDFFSVKFRNTIYLDLFH